MAAFNHSDSDTAHACLEVALIQGSLLRIGDKYRFP